MKPALRSLAARAPYYISVYPNAGLPNSMGGYDQTPEMMEEEMKEFVDEGLVNIIAGVYRSLYEYHSGSPSAPAGACARLYVGEWSGTAGGEARNQFRECGRTL